MSDENENLEGATLPESVIESDSDPVLPESVFDLEPVASDKPLKVIKAAMVASIESPEFVRPAVLRLFAGSKIVAECAAFKGHKAKQMINGEFVIVRPE